MLFASTRPADQRFSSTKASHVPPPGPGEVHIRHAAVGLNYADTYFRTGYYPAPLPNGMGVEAAGTILAVGTGVDGFAPGDRVTYTGSPLGAYSTERVMPTASLIKLPETISFETAAAMTMRGLTAAYLLRRICPTLKSRRHDPGARRRRRARPHRHAVGQAARTERHRHRVERCEGDDRAAHTAATTSSSTAASRCAKRVRELTDGAGVAVVYDTVGKDTFAESLDSVRRRGMLVCVGTSSGPIPPIDALQLAIKGSLYVTRPALADYIADPDERALLAGELFDHVAQAAASSIESQSALHAERRRAGASRSRIPQDDGLVDLRHLRKRDMRVEQLTCSIGAELIGVDLGARRAR